MTIGFDTHYATASASPSPTITGAAGSPSRAPHGMPPVIAAKELYFWTAKWQSQEREFERARGADELIRVETVDDMLADLMSASDD